MELKELFFEEKGYNPLVLTENWQLAQLNFTETQKPSDIDFLERHDFTDETFTLFKGKAILITLDEKENELSFTKLRTGATYNVETNVAHNIAMSEDARILITEGRDAHLKGKITEKINENFKKQIINYCENYLEV